ncbi:hypothetical protein GBF35_26115 [Nonomuraea phyllanthi]|uniref:hypothetical protein n=1 Tax=Nonomuraea phyllanthi TaxID=2219224 RepID=UPI00129346CE|nr:hypothetical protein [Nonomuraea phyllanthi]QFY09670.1 hypothetical protein GBF35_26115 [Nonomuraea phyllanthi]
MALDYLEEAKVCATRADNASEWEARSAYSAQASACAAIAAAELKAADVAFRVAEMSAMGIGPREAKDWRAVLKVEL